MYTLEDVYKTFPSGCTEDYKILRAFEMGKQATDKRIAELIALINAERERQEKCDDVHLRTIADLEKENAELKSGCGMCYRKDKENLTKAKEIILRLYNAGRDVLMCSAEEKVYDNLSNAINDKSIEQFISEVEK